jgi:hypothetical protein
VSEVANVDCRQTVMATPPHRIAEALENNSYVAIDGGSRSDADAWARTLGRVAPGWERLVAKEAAEAAPWSLSGTFGRSAFPWHTDGVIARFPPRYVLMHHGGAHPVEGTLLLDCSSKDGRLLRLAAQISLRVADSRGRVRYVPALNKETGRSVLRWDPRISTPFPRRAGEAMSEALAESTPTATIPWLPGRTLIFKNDVLLHARPKIPSSQRRSLDRLYVY